MSIECKIVEQGLQLVMSVRTRCAVEKLPELLGKEYMRIYEYLSSLGAKPTGAPFVAYYNMDMSDLDIEVGFPITEAVPEKDDMQISSIKAGRYVTALYTGPYSEMEPAYNTLMKWMEENELEYNGVAYEFYLNDPSMVPESELQTQIMFGLK